MMNRKFRIILITFIIPYTLIMAVIVYSGGLIIAQKNIKLETSRLINYWEDVKFSAYSRYLFRGNLEEEEWQNKIDQFDRYISELNQIYPEWLLTEDINETIYHTGKWWGFIKKEIERSDLLYAELLETELGKILKYKNFQQLVGEAYFYSYHNEPLDDSDLYTLKSMWSNLDVVLEFSTSNNIFERNLLKLHSSIERFVDRVIRMIIAGCTALSLSILISAVLYIRYNQSELIRREEDLSKILNSMGDAMIVTNPQGQIIRMNPIAEKMTGQTVSGAFGKDLFDIINIRKNGKKETLNINGIFTLESESARKVTISASGSPIRNPDGKITGRVIIFRDISNEFTMQDQLLSLRNYLYAIIDNMPSILVGVNKGGDIILWNKTAVEKTGIPIRDALGMKLTEALPQLDPEIFAESLETGEIILEQNRLRETHSGTVYEDIIIYPLLKKGEKEAVIRIDDVTEKTRMQELLIQNEKIMSIGGLAAGMAHEINNPLAGMIQTADVMALRLSDRELIPANRKAAERAGLSLSSLNSYMEQRKIFEMIRAIQDSGARIAVIVKNILSFSRMDTDKKEASNMEILLEKSLELAASDYNMKKQYDFRKIRIERSYEPGLPPLLCERAKIQQVILNLLRNGAQAMHEAQTENPCFLLKLYRGKNGSGINMEIEDNGPGMTERVQKRIFEPFFTTKEVGEGTGLGLSVSYFIIAKDHNGEIQVESRPGAGTRFIISLPLEAKKRIEGGPRADHTDS